MKLKLRPKEEEGRKEEEVDTFDTEELQMRLDALTMLMKDIDVSTIVKSYRALIPLDSHKIDYGRIPSNLIEYIERAIELQIDILQLQSSSEEEIKFLESYKIQTKLRVFSAVEGWLLKMILGSRGGR